MNINIKNFNPNVVVRHIGNLFKYNNNPTWYLTIWCQPRQEKAWTLFSNLPLISRGKVLNSSSHNESKLNQKIISFTNRYTLTGTTLAEFIGANNHQSPQQRQEALQNAFNLSTLQESNIIIPQLELARALFLWNSYLCRACLSSTVLQLEFDVHTNAASNITDIYILNTSTFPLTALNEEGTRSVLAWMLTSPSIITSYNSIYQHYQTNRQLSSNLEKWDFRDRKSVV